MTETELVRGQRSQASERTLRSVSHHALEVVLYRRPSSPRCSSRSRTCPQCPSRTGTYPSPSAKWLQTTMWTARTQEFSAASSSISLSSSPSAVSPYAARHSPVFMAYHRVKARTGQHPRRDPVRPAQPAVSPSTALSPSSQHPVTLRGQRTELQLPKLAGTGLANGSPLQLRTILSSAGMAYRRTKYRAALPSRRDRARPTPTAAVVQLQLRQFLRVTLANSPVTAHWDVASRMSEDWMRRYELLSHVWTASRAGLRLTR